MLTSRTRWLVPQYPTLSARSQRQLIRALLVDMCATQTPGSGDVPTPPAPEPGNTNRKAQR